MVRFLAADRIRSMIPLPGQAVNSGVVPNCAALDADCNRVGVLV